VTQVKAASMHLFVHVSTASCMQCHMDASNCCTKYAGKFATPICHILCLGCYQGMTRFAVRLETQHCKSVPCSLQVRLAKLSCERCYRHCQTPSETCTRWNGPTLLALYMPLMLPLPMLRMLPRQPSMLRCCICYRLMGFHFITALNCRAGITRWPSQLHLMCLAEALAGKQAWPWQKSVGYLSK